MSKIFLSRGNTTSAMAIFPASHLPKQTSSILRMQSIMLKSLLTAWIIYGLLAITGCGSGVSSSSLSLSQSAVDFGSVAVGQQATQTLTLSNSGPIAIQLQSTSLSGTGFTVSGASMPMTLNAGQKVALQVSFKPVSTGDASGQLAIASSSSAGSALSDVTLNGTGITQTSPTPLLTPTLTINPTSVSFGNVAAGTTASQNITLASTGTAAVQVNAVTVSGTEFTVSGVTFPLTIQPSQQVTLQVIFTPAISGSASGTITVNSNSSTGATSQIALSGKGVAQTTPTLTVSSTSVNFGSVNVGSTGTQNVTLSSTGTAAVQVYSATLTGSAFALTAPTFPVTLNPGQQLALQVVFQPASSGAATGSLAISSNSSGSTTANVTLSGTGVTTSTHSVDLTWSAPTSTPDPIAGYNVYRSTVSGSNYQLLNASALTQLSFTDSNVQSATTYYYVVRSVDSTGLESNNSSQFTAVIP